MGRSSRSAEEICALRSARAAKKDSASSWEDSCCFDGLVYEFSGGLVLRVEEDWLGTAGADGIAGLQWAGGVRLARLFDEEMEAGFWVDKECLELGAGCGLTSCVVSALGGHVMCTDAEVQHAAATVAFNEDAMRRRAGAGRWKPPQCETFVWGPDLPETLCRRYDVVFAGDCLYAEWHAAALLSALCAAADPETLVVVCGAVGADAHAAFQELAPRAFEVQDWAGNPLEKWDQREVLRLQRRRPPLSAVIPAVKRPIRDASRFERSLDRKLEAGRVVTSSSLLSNARNLLLEHDAWFVGDLSIVVIDDVLDSDECRRLVDAVRACDELTFWGVGRNGDEARKFRDADTLEMQCDSLADELWRRIEPHIFDEGDSLFRLPDDALLEERVDDWRPIGLNRNFLFAEYCRRHAGFAPHNDGATREGLNRRSYLSVIIYLSDLNDGGQTRFYDSRALRHLDLDKRASDRWTAPDAFAIGEVACKVGRVLVFDQRLVHEGRPPPEAKAKIIIRTDIIFERAPKIFNNDCDVQAFSAYEAALDHAEHDRHDQARHLFEKSRRLSPRLASALGLC